MKVYNSFEELTAGLIPHIENTLKESVASDVVEKLKANIQKDVYDTYNPSNYGAYDRRNELKNSIDSKVDVIGDEVVLTVFSTAKPSKSYFDISYSYATPGSLIKWIEGYSSSDTKLDMSARHTRSKVRSLFGAEQSGEKFPWLYSRKPMTHTQRYVMRPSYQRKIVKLINKGGK